MRGKAARAEALRRKARLILDAASIKTNGGHLEDRLLVEIANYLERQAAALDKIKPEDC